MALSVVQLCNLALSRIGISQTIDDLEEGSAEALACKTVYEASRDGALADYAWPFAERQAALGLAATLSGSEWAYSLRRPPDCLRALRVISGSRTGPGIPYAIGSDSAGGLIYCDQSIATLIYTARLEDPGLWSQTFAMALAWRIAMDLAPALARSDAAAERAERQYGKALSSALSNRLNERQTPADDLADAIACRE